MQIDLGSELYIHKFECLTCHCKWEERHKIPYEVLEQIAEQEYNELHR